MNAKNKNDNECFKWAVASAEQKIWLKIWLVILKILIGQILNFQQNSKTSKSLKNKTKKIIVFNAKDSIYPLKTSECTNVSQINCGYYLKNKTIITVGLKTKVNYKLNKQ